MQAIFKNFGIYIHVPFCATKCAFCRFYKMRPSEEDATAYVLTLKKELENLSQNQQMKRPDTMFWGGGTPTALSEKNIELLANSISKILPTKEWTVEVSPSTATQSKLQLLKDLGVSRISLGVQSFNPKTLRSLGRAHTLKATETAIDTISDIGFKHFSLDLIFGAEEQTISEWIEDMHYASTKPVDHISAYCLEFESGTSCCGGITDGRELAKREREGDFMEESMKVLPELGFNQYEISNYAKTPDSQCLHNLSTWHMAEWLGLGPAAASQYNKLRYRNTPSLEKWATAIDANSTAREDIVELDDDEMYSSALIFGLRMNAGVNLSILKNRFPTANVQKYIPTLELLHNEGLLNFSDNNVSLTFEGRLLADSIATELL